MRKVAIVLGVVLCSCFLLFAGGVAFLLFSSQFINATPTYATVTYDSPNANYPATTVTPVSPGVYPANQPYYSPPVSSAEYTEIQPASYPATSSPYSPYTSVPTTAYGTDSSTNAKKQELEQRYNQLSQQHAQLLRMSLDEPALEREVKILESKVRIKQTLIQLSEVEKNLAFLGENFTNSKLSEDAGQISQAVALVKQAVNKLNETPEKTYSDTAPPEYRNSDWAAPDALSPAQVIPPPSYPEPYSPEPVGQSTLEEPPAGATEVLKQSTIQPEAETDWEFLDLPPAEDTNVADPTPLLEPYQSVDEEEPAASVEISEDEDLPVDSELDLQFKNNFPGSSIPPIGGFGPSAGSPTEAPIERTLPPTVSVPLEPTPDNAVASPYSVPTPSQVAPTVSKSQAVTPKLNTLQPIAPIRKPAVTPSKTKVETKSVTPSVKVPSSYRPRFKPRETDAAGTSKPIPPKVYKLQAGTITANVIAQPEEPEIENRVLMLTPGSKTIIEEEEAPLTGFSSTDEVQYFPAGPEFKLEKEAKALRAKKKASSKATKVKKEAVPAKTDDLDSDED